MRNEAKLAIAPLVLLILIGCGAQPPGGAASPVGTPNAHSSGTQKKAEFAKDQWVDGAVSVYYADGSVHNVAAKKRNLELGISGEHVPLPVVVFWSPDGKRVWANADMNLYADTNKEILGLRLDGHLLQLRRSLIPAVEPGESLAAIAQRFQHHADPAAMIDDGSEEFIELSNELHPDFFTEGGSGGLGSRPHLTGLSASDERLRVDIESPRHTYSATIWIDLDSHAVVDVSEKTLGSRPNQEQATH